MSFKIEPELREAFHDAAAKERRPAAQVLRELMREFVVKQKSKKHDG